MRQLMRIFDVEDALWWFLSCSVMIASIVSPAKDDASMLLDLWPVGLCLVQSLLKEQPATWKNRPLADPGLVMSILLVPTLFQSLAHHDPTMLAYARCTSLLLCVPKMMMAGSMLPVQLQIILFASIHYSSGNVCLLFVVSWWVLNSCLTPLLSGILTWGEFRVLLASASVVVTEWMVQTTTTTTTSTKTSSSTISASYIALSGAVGCAVSILLAKNKLSFTYKLLVQVVGPLVVVESCLWCKDYTPSSNAAGNGLLLPLCLHWLLEFLESKDGQEYPQFYGLIYWIVLLILLAIPTVIIINARTREEEEEQQQQQQRYSYAVRRKWFHLVAVLLFGPITHVFPDLMSLSYAIALCGLVVVETIRSDCPLLQSFYQEWIDPTKDEDEGILLSHMFLLLGCAMPLWIAQACTPFNDHSSLLAQWGVLCLGVGDAMGAVVGSKFGKHRWGRNGRTLEGSLAMWTSMLVVGGIAGVSPIALFLATTLTTLLEAFTLQMDNLILPLAGSIVLLLLQPVS